MPPCYFLSSRGQRIKILQKLNKTDCFSFYGWFHFLWHFSQKTDSHNKYMILLCVWFIF